ncbi:MAG: GDP-mannose 4,6-dehydratase [Candidatus Obscuribacterales bacterium]|nr:GDP-mannose 4,6-dehydratase [Candidatus Obscuribacterales bacterium]
MTPHTESVQASISNKECEPIEPNSYYAITKAAATMACRQVSSAKGLYIPTLRLYSVYGPYEDPKRLMPTMIGKGLAGTLPPLVDPDIARDFVYIDDVIDAYLKATTKKSNEFGPIYNVGSGTQTSIGDIVSVARKQFDIKTEPEWGSMDNRKWDSSNWVANIEKIKTELGWQPQIPIDTGLERFASWIKSTEAVKSRYEYTPVDTLK